MRRPVAIRGRWREAARYAGRRTKAAVTVRDRRMVRDVQRMVFFVGYARSGSSLVGQMLNAHRHMLVAHEADSMRRVREGWSRDRILRDMIDHDRRFACKEWTDTDGYPLGIPGQWQGRADRLEVIGDKKAYYTTMHFLEEPALLAMVRERFALPVRFVHLIRHPLDNIAAMSRRSGDLDDAEQRYFRLCDTVEQVRAEVGPDTLVDVHHEDIVTDTSVQLERLCTFLGVDAPSDYLHSCASIVFASPRRSRDSVTWSPGQIDRVAARAAAIDHLARYTDWDADPAPAPVS